MVFRFNQQTRLILIMSAVGAATAVFFTLFTNNIWEDYFITFRHSLNLIKGNGLVYNEGERVHGFTSPLGVLLPAALGWVLGASTFEPTLIAFRVVSIATFAASVALLAAAMRRTGETVFSAALLGVLLSFEPKAVAFSINGMETAFVLFFMALGFYATTLATSRSVWLLAVSWAGLMYSRPDGCIAAFAILLGNVVWAQGPRRQVVAISAKALCLSVLMYLPWLVAASVYYGSPVPHTVLAKAAHTSGGGVSGWVVQLPSRIAGVATGYLESGRILFEPIYANFGSWPQWVPVYGSVITVLGTIGVFVPGVARVGKIASLTFILGIIYLRGIYGGIAFPWYMPPFAWCGITAALCTGLAVARSVQTEWLARLSRAAGILCLSVWLLVEGTLLLATARQLYVQQSEIEFGLRRPIGEWLRERARPGDTIYLECLGYIGYFSEQHMDDFPGLVSPRVVSIGKRVGLDFARIAAELRPDWIVARPWELEALRQEQGITESYELLRSFTRVDALEDYRQMWGVNFLLWDSRFAVLRLRRSATASGVVEEAVGEQTNSRGR